MELPTSPASDEAPAKSHTGRMDPHRLTITDPLLSSNARPHRRASRPPANQPSAAPTPPSHDPTAMSLAATAARHAVAASSPPPPSVRHPTCGVPIKRRREEEEEEGRGFGFNGEEDGLTGKKMV